MAKTKSSYIQLRVSEEEKKQIFASAAQEERSVSEFILARVTSAFQETLLKIIKNLCGVTLSNASYHLAELHDVLKKSTKKELRVALQRRPEYFPQDMGVANYVAAMLETTLSHHAIELPIWLAEIRPLREPYFASQLKSLKAYLLINSPVQFKRRNIFIDSTVGARV